MDKSVQRTSGCSCDELEQLAGGSVQWPLLSAASFRVLSMADYSMQFHVAGQSFIPQCYIEGAFGNR